MSSSLLANKTFTTQANYSVSGYSSDISVTFLNYLRKKFNLQRLRHVEKKNESIFLFASLYRPIYFNFSQTTGLRD